MFRVIVASYLLASLLYGSLLLGYANLAADGTPQYAGKRNNHQHHQHTHRDDADGYAQAEQHGAPTRSPDAARSSAHSMGTRAEHFDSSPLEREERSPGLASGLHNDLVTCLLCFDGLAAIRTSSELISGSCIVHDSFIPRRPCSSFEQHQYPGFISRAPPFLRA
ncbi:hypothetical protein N8295_02505 [Pseudomonadales bacterium]|nr:hypothetical protein [Pseudomonadales bacterium]